MRTRLPAVRGANAKRREREEEWCSQRGLLRVSGRDGGVSGSCGRRRRRRRRRVFGGRFEDAVAGGECGVKRGEFVLA